MESDAHLLALGEDRRVEGLEIALAHVGQQQTPLPVQLVALHRATDGACGVTADRRMHGVEPDLGAGQTGD